MSLHRKISRLGTSEWEVDESGIYVFRRHDQERHWFLSSSIKAEEGEEHYLVRHGLLGRSFPTRARAVDAARMALAKRASPLSGAHPMAEGEV